MRSPRRRSQWESVLFSRGGCGRGYGDGSRSGRCLEREARTLGTSWSDAEVLPLRNPSGTGRYGGGGRDNGTVCLGALSIFSPLFMSYTS